MNKTNVFLTDDKFQEIQALLETTMSFDLDTNITTTTPGDKEAAWIVIDDFAVSNGLPRLPDGHHYGVTSERELVTK